MNVIQLYGTEVPLPITYLSKYNLYRIAFDIQKTDTGYSWYNLDFNVKPSITRIKNEIIEFYNRQVDYKILHNFVFKDINIWLSSENQNNYTNALITGLEYLKIKGGTDNKPEYLELTSSEDIKTFINNMQTFINSCIEEGWSKKDSINYNDYLSYTNY